MSDVLNHHPLVLLARYNSWGREGDRKKPTTERAEHPCCSQVISKDWEVPLGRVLTGIVGQGWGSSTTSLASARCRLGASATWGMRHTAPTSGQAVSWGKNQNKSGFAHGRVFSCQIKQWQCVQLSAVTVGLTGSPRRAELRDTPRFSWFSSRSSNRWAFLPVLLSWVYKEKNWKTTSNNPILAQKEPL